MKIKNLVVLGGLFLSSPVAFSSDWVEVYKDDEAVIAVDKQSMSYNEYLREVKVWDKYSLASGVVAVSNKVIDCDSYSRKTLTQVYSAPDSEDKKVEEEYPSWERASPDSRGC